MKTKPTMALVVSAMLLTALTGSGVAIPISIDSTISFSRSSKNKDKSTAGAAAIFKPSTRKHVDFSAPTKPLKSSKSRGKKNALQLGSPGVDPLSPSSWVMSGFGTAAISGLGLEKQATSGLEILTGQPPVEPSFTLSPPTIVPYSATQTVQTVQNVPDGGATALLLSFSVFGLGWLKRKSAA